MDNISRLSIRLCLWRILKGIRIAAGLLALTIASGCVSNSASQLGAGLKTEALPTPLTPEQVEAARIEAEKKANAIDPAIAPRIIEPDAAKRTAGSLPPASVAPSKTGTFPTFNQNPTAQTVQLSKSEAEQIRQKLLAASAKADAAVAPQTVEASQAEIKKLQEDAATHAAKKLKKIEKE